MQPTKANLAAAAKSIRILAQQDYYKSDDALLDVVVETLTEQADDSDHINRMVLTWVKRTRQMLHPADIPQLAIETSHRPKLPAPCPACKSEGDFLVTEANGTSGVYRCQCARGQKLAESDRIARDSKVVIQ